MRSDLSIGYWITSNTWARGDGPGLRPTKSFGGKHWVRPPLALILYKRTRAPRGEGIMKIVLGYSGGLDTSVIVPWLTENYGAGVICMAGDVGQHGGLEGLQAKAFATGASAF